MTELVRGDSVSSAWLASAQTLMAVPGRAIVNLAVSISNPTVEVGSIRTLLDAFLAKASTLNRKLPPNVESVANTIFQSAFYRPEAPDPEVHLYEMERRIRRVVRKHSRNTHGTYFERLVAYPSADGEFNQLQHIVMRLRGAAKQGWRNRNQYELALFNPTRDSYPVGFPCLSHVSITLDDGRLHATALYRNQYFIARAYGNFLGLGELLRFIAAESGFTVGEVMCVASHAKLDIEDYGRDAVTELLRQCAEQRQEMS